MSRKTEREPGMIGQLLVLGIFVAVAASALI